MKRYLGQLGGQLGVGLCVAGFLLVFLGWNGAASRNFVPAQFPYLISGGIAGLCLVVVGVGVVVVQNQRADRAALQQSIERLIDAVERSGVSPNGSRTPALPSGAVAGAADLVIAGRDSYHRATCQLVEERDNAELIPVEEAAARDLTPCRVCNPPTPGAAATDEVEIDDAEVDDAEVDEVGAARPRRQLRAR